MIVVRSAVRSPVEVEMLCTAVIRVFLAVSGLLPCSE